MILTLIKKTLAFECSDLCNFRQLKGDGWSGPGFFFYHIDPLKKKRLVGHPASLTHPNNIELMRQINDNNIHCLKTHF